MVMVGEAVVERPAATFTDGERDRLSALLERYRALVQREVAGEALSAHDERMVMLVLESLWLVPGCWPRDVAAWRAMQAVRARMLSLQAGAGGVATLDGLRHREAELEVVHPHLFCSVHVAAYLRWETARRAMRWSSERV